MSKPERPRRKHSSSSSEEVVRISRRVIADAYKDRRASIPIPEHRKPSTQSASTRPSERPARPARHTTDALPTRERRRSSSREARPGERRSSSRENGTRSRSHSRENGRETRSAYTLTSRRSSHRKNEGPKYPLQRIVVLRHGERGEYYQDWLACTTRQRKNADASFGKSTPLTSRGRKEARSSGKLIAQTLGIQIDRVISSKMLRTAQTAKYVIQSYRDGEGPKCVEISNALGEYMPTVEEAQGFADLKATLGGGFATSELAEKLPPDSRFGGVVKFESLQGDYTSSWLGESEKQMQDRVGRFIRDLIVWADQKRSVKTVLLVTHSDIVAELTRNLLGGSHKRGCPANVSIFDRKRNLDWKAFEHEGTEILRYCAHLHDPKEC